MIFSDPRFLSAAPTISQAKTRNPCLTNNSIVTLPMPPPAPVTKIYLSDMTKNYTIHYNIVNDIVSLYQASGDFTSFPKAS